MSMLELDLPLPEQKAALSLRRQIVRHLLKHRPEAGSPLFSESQLMRHAGVSRSTVRRALSPLERSGWIERHQGRGTFVGPRAAMGVTPRSSHLTVTPVDAGRRLIRMAVMTDRNHPWQRDPYSAEVLRGLDAAADHDGLSVELMGVALQGRDAAIRRLRHSRPDVMALLAPRMPMGFMIGVATMLQIPVVGTGDSAARMGLPAVSYDDREAAAEAVRHLHEHGHRRIALVQQEDLHHYVVRRRQGFWQGVADLGLPVDQNLELWLPTWNAMEVEIPHEQVDRLLDFIRRQRPTAVLFSEGKLVSLLGELVRAGRVRIPQDLSFVSFDQIYSDYSAWMGSLRPTVVALPLQQVGRRLSELARRVLAGDATPTVIRERCDLIPGDSVAPVVDARQTEAALV